MATVFAPFDSYTVYYTARGQDAQIAAAVIDCFDQGSWIGQIQFLPKSLPFTNGGGAAPPPPNLLVIYYSVDEFPNVYTIIRNEKPLAIWFDLDNRYGYVLTTDQEPVGQPDPQAPLRAAREAATPVVVQTSRVPGGQGSG